MKLTKTQKIVAFSLPILIGAYLIYRQLTKPATVVPAGDQKTNEKVGTKTDVAKLPTSDFPLKVGSGTKSNPNKSVMSLQDELGINIDGVFGKKTLAALQAQVGKSQITDAADLQSTLEQIWAQDSAVDTAASKSDTSDQIIFNFENGATEIWNNKDGNWRGVYNNGGDWLYNSDQFSVSMGDSFKTSEFEPYLTDSVTGNLILKHNPINGGLLFLNPSAPTGLYYIVDPTTITVS